MVPYVWNPDATFRITDLVRGDVVCVGRAAMRCNARCTWDIRAKSLSDANAARNLLRVMSANPPTLVTSEQLRTLASHCLCQYHKGQILQATSELRTHLAVAIQAYEQYNNAIRQHEAFRGQLLQHLGLEAGDHSDESVVRRVRILVGHARRT